MRKNYWVKSILLFSVLFVSMTGSVFAQLAMTRSYFSGAYTSIAGAPGAILSTATGDDDMQAGIAIGFTFNYLGTNYTAVDVNTNGAMAFSGLGLTAVARNNEYLFQTLGPNSIISAWWDDLALDASSGIWTHLSGAPGSQVFTIEWKDVLSYYFTSTQRINFQVLLYEGSNVIEFRYGAVIAGAVNTAESASIGIENAIGGGGNYLDVVTGGHNVGNYFVNSTTGWPTRFYRLTPGLPAPLAGGVYSAGSAGTYPNLSEAVADVNHRGITGPIVISLTDALYDINPGGGDNWFPIAFGAVAGTSIANTITLQPASGVSTLSYDGALGGGLANFSTATAAGVTTEPILALVGTDYVLVNNLNIQSGPAGVVDRGIAVLNSSALDGATFNAFTNINITLNRAITSTIAIDQRLPTTPTNATGANSNNAYLNLTISNTYNGIYLLGNATYPDLNCQVGTLSPSVFNTIGGAGANDIGGGTLQSYGIRMGNQSGASIFNNIVQNVGSTTTTDGILVELSQGVTNVHRNQVRNIRGTSPTATTMVSGIRSNIATSAGHDLRVYNNSVCSVLSAYTGALSATRQLKGIYVQAAGGGVTTSSINVDHNSVYLDGSASPNISSNCFEIGTTSGPVINVRNNIFMNATGTQTTPAVHLGWRSTSATLTGNTGSVSNYNDIWIPNATQGFTGQGNTTNYATLANWQAAMVGQDANSIAADPGYLNVATCDLHASGPSVNNTGTPIPWVTTDIDNQARSGTNPDIGFDEFTPVSLDMGAVALITPAAGACYTSTEPVTIQIRNWGSTAVDFSIDNTTVTVNVTGAIIATINSTLTSGTLASGATQNVLVGNINMSAAGTYTFNAYTTVTGDGNASNDAMLPVNRVFSAGTALASLGNVCFADSATLSLSGHNGSTIQWEISTDNGATWTAIPGATVTPYRVSPADTSWYRAQVCGLIYSVFDTLNVIPTSPPTTTGDSICGTGVANLSASGSGTLNWYDAPTGGTIVNTGPSYSPIVSTTTSYYVSSATGAQNGMHTTTYAAGNGASGNVFTIKALTNITITNFDGHTSTTAPGDWEVWYRPNDYLLFPGSENSSVGWTQLGIATNVPQMGTGLVTPIPILFSLPIPAGMTYSFQVFNNGGVNYTNGTVLGALFNANSDLEFYQGRGGAGFNMPNSPRVFNGRIHYTSGCGSTRTQVTATVLPADSVNITASSMSSCGGDSVTLTAVSANAAYTYTWSPGATLSSTTGNPVTAGPVANTSYIVNAIDTAGCTATDTIAISYIAKPVITATVTPDTICAGDSILLSSSMPPTSFQVGTGTIVNTTTTYPAPYGNWYWGSRHQMLILASELTGMGVTAGFLNSMAFDVTTVNAAAPLDNFEIKLALTGVTAITTWQAPAFTSVFFAPVYAPAVGQNPHMFSTPFYWDGVSNILVETCHQNSAYTDNVSVNQSATPFSSTVHYRADAAGVCANPAVTGAFTQRPNMYFTKMGVFTYDWTPSATLVAPTSMNTAGTANASGYFTIMVTDTATGCVGSDSAFVFANPAPVVSITGGGTICGTTTLLDAGGPFASYLWSTSDSIQMITVGSSGNYSVDVVDSLGCSNSDSVSVTLNPNPTVNLGPDTAACQGASVTLNAGNPGATYLWSTSDSTQTISVSTTGSYSVAVTDSNNCSGSDTVNVTINALPTVGYTSPIDTLCSVAAPVTLTGGSPAGGTYSGTGVSAGMFSPATAGVGNHTVTYTYTDANGCTNSATQVITVQVCPGMADGFNTMHIGLYPNPNDGKFTFTVPMDAAGDLSYTISDARGVIVMKNNSSEPGGLYTQTVDLASYTAGVYFLLVNVNGMTAYKRFVVQR